MASKTNSETRRQERDVITRWIVAVLVVFGMAVLLGMNILNRLIWEETGWVGVLDMQYGLSVREILTAVSEYTPFAKTYYVLFALLDAVFPLIYTSIMVLIIAQTRSSTALTGWLAKNGHYIPLLAMVFDYIENLSIITLLMIHLPNTRLFAYVAYGASGAKILFFVASVVLVITAMLYKKSSKGSSTDPSSRG